MLHVEVYYQPGINFDNVVLAQARPTADALLTIIGLVPFDTCAVAEDSCQKLEAE